jgi:amino acid transporter
MARAYWGWGDLVVILTAFTGLTAVYLSSTQGTSRIVFALARHGLLPAILAHLSGENRVPRNAVFGVLTAVILLDLTSLFLLGNGLDSFTWWANALVFFAALTFLSVNVANALYFWRYARVQFRLVRNLLIPLAGVLLNGYLFYAAFFSALWGSDWRMGKSVVVACVALVAAQMLAVGYVRLVRPQRLSQGAPMGVQ